MKKIIFLSLILASIKLFGTSTLEDERYNFALSSGYVFKHDSVFKDVYGHGAVSIITGDFCYYPWEVWGIGTQLSYWRAKGRTSFLRVRTHLHEVPLTFYVRRKKDFNCGLQLYGSLGAGALWVKEKSYLADYHTTKAIGLAEAGLQYPIWKFINILGAFRYVFPQQRYSCKTADSCDKLKACTKVTSCEKAMFGGYELRAGISFSF